MATVPLTPQVGTGGSGAALTNVANAQATGNTYTFQNDGKTLLHFEKTGAGSCTVTVTSPATVGGLAVADPTFTVPASTGDVWIGPFRPDLFNDSNGLVSFTVSEATGLTVDIITPGP